MTEEPPTVPPEKSMQMDFSTFQTQQNKSVSASEANNFGQAVVRAAILKAVVDVNLFIPRVLLKAAANSEAEFNGDGEWAWSYARAVNEDDFEVRLTATRRGENVDWEFYVSNSQLELGDKLFFSGVSNADGSQGTWTYYSLENSADEAVSKVEWEIMSENNVNLRLDVLSNRYENEGDYITYNFDRTLKTALYYDAAANETTEIQWNTDTKVGYLVTPDFEEGSQVCWDANFQDISCSEL